MKNFIILTPVYNDWDSLKKLISEINENIEITKKTNILNLNILVLYRLSRKFQRSIYAKQSILIGFYLKLCGEGFFLVSQ